MSACCAPQHADDTPDPQPDWLSSETETAQATCPLCSQGLEVVVWRVINARHDLEPVHRLREGTLFQTTCPHCKRLIGLTQHCLYLDPDAGACIHLVATDEQARDASQLLRRLAEVSVPIGCSRRRVASDARILREKALAFGSGLDDRVIELLKLDYEGQGRLLGVIGEDGSADVRFEGCDLGGRLTFALDAGYGTLELSVPRRDYALLSAAIARSSLAGEQPLVVDQSWARHAMKQLQDERALP